MKRLLLGTVIGLILMLTLNRAYVRKPARPDPASGVGTSCDAFLNSLGVNTHVDQGYNPDSYVAPLRYLGIRNIRDGQRNIPGYIMLHQKTGIRADMLVSPDGLATAAKTLARAGALLAIEGPNEPNNFPITYKGQKGGGTAESWKAVAEFQKDLYNAVKNDPELKQYPVFSVSEAGAETDNVGLQFLTIPAGAGTLSPDGTRFADFANVHNYVSGASSRYGDNQAWRAADPIESPGYDGLYGEYGKTWKGHFRGYSETELQTLPRVTTETGWDSGIPGGERVQGIVLVNTYLAQFKRGWAYTFIYELGDGEGGEGNQGLFHKDWTPKLAATYIHNLTSILAGRTPVDKPGKLDYSIANAPATVHDLLLQKGSGTFELVVWGEQVAGSNDITIDLGRPRAKVNIYDTTTGTRPIRALRDARSVPLTASDHAMIVEIID